MEKSALCVFSGYFPHMLAQGLFWRVKVRVIVITMMVFIWWYTMTVCRGTFAGSSVPLSVWIPFLLFLWRALTSHYSVPIFSDYFYSFPYQYFTSNMKKIWSFLISYYIVSSDIEWLVRWRSQWICQERDIVFILFVKSYVEL